MQRITFAVVIAVIMIASSFAYAKEMSFTAGSGITLEFPAGSVYKTNATAYAKVTITGGGYAESGTQGEVKITATGGPAGANIPSATTFLPSGGSTAYPPGVAVTMPDKDGTYQYIATIYVHQSNGTHTPVSSTPVALTVDGTPPEVQITAPAAGQIVPVVLTLNVDISFSDNLSGVSKLEFYVDDSLYTNNGTHTIDPASTSGTNQFWWDTTAYPDAYEAKIKVVATDKAGNVSEVTGDNEFTVIVDPILMLDPGHGLGYYGTGAWNGDRNLLEYKRPATPTYADHEDDIVLRLASATSAYFAAHNSNIQVVLYRTTQDDKPIKSSPPSYVETLNARMDWVENDVLKDKKNLGDHFYLAIHTDGGPATAHGCTVITNSATNGVSLTSHSEHFADNLRDRVVLGTDAGMHLRHYDESLHVLRENFVPAALVEFGFHSNTGFNYNAGTHECVEHDRTFWYDGVSNHYYTEEELLAYNDSSHDNDQNWHGPRYAFCNDFRTQMVPITIYNAANNYFSWVNAASVTTVNGKKKITYPNALTKP